MILQCKLTTIISVEKPIIHVILMTSLSHMNNLQGIFDSFLITCKSL